MSGNPNLTGGTGDLGTKDGTKLNYCAHVIDTGGKIIGSVNCIVLWNVSDLFIM